MKTVYWLFNWFGKVKSIQSGCDDCSSCFTVEFRDGQIAAQLLNKRQLKLDGSTFQVRSINKFHHQSILNNIDVVDNIDPLLRPPSAQDSPKHILNLLNDHCLCEIFQNIDHLADFHSIANVCVRFNQIAKLVFPSKIRLRWINFDEWVFNNGTSFNRIILSQIENFLCNFGSSIVSLQFRPYYFQQTPNVENLALKMIAKYCKNLRCLDIKITYEHNEISNEICSIFSKLKILRIRLPNYGFISACTEIEELEIRNQWNITNRLPEISFPKLIKFKGPCYSLSTGFLKQNLRIEDLDIISCYSDSPEMFQFISRNMLNLKKLTLCSPIKLEHFSENFLNNVECCFQTLNFENISLISRLQNVTQIIFLQIRESLENQLIILAKNLHNLQKIEIKNKHTVSAISIATIKQVLQHANLSEFHHKKSGLYHFDENDYNEVLDVISARKNHKKLSMTFTSCSHFSNVRNDFMKKVIVMDEHPDLSVFMQYDWSDDIQHCHCCAWSL